MKKIIILIAIFSIVLSSFSQKQTGYDIKVTIKNTKDTLLYLATYFTDKKVLKDSVFVNKKNKNVFHFKGKEPLDKGVYIIATGNKIQLFDIIIDKNQKFEIETDTIDYNKKTKFINSPDNLNFQKYTSYIAVKQDIQSKLFKEYNEAKENKKEKQFIDELEQKLKDNYKEIENYTQDFIKNNPEALFSKILQANQNIKIPETPTDINDKDWKWRYYKNHYWDNIDLTDDRMLRTPIFYEKFTTFFQKVIVQDPDSIIKEADIFIAKTSPNKEMFKFTVAWITNTYEIVQIMGQEAVFVHMAEKYYETNQCWWVSESLKNSIVKRAKQLKAILINAQAPELIMPDTNNIFISNYAPKTKYIVMWFWDPDCGHCKTETPKLKKLYDQYKDSLNFEVYAIGMDNDTTRWKNYIKENKLNWINVGRQTANIDYKEVYDIYSSPVMVVLNSKKKIIARKLDVEHFLEFIKHYEKKYSN